MEKCRNNIQEKNIRKYIHYGSSVYDPERVSVWTGGIKTKPQKGLWASPVDSDWGWKQWCESEQWAKSSLEEHFSFYLEGANILQVKSEKDILPYVIHDEDIKYWPKFGLTSICDKIKSTIYEDYDGIELFLSQNYLELHMSMFCGWDCDSICVWNPEVIRILEEKR